MFCVFDLKLSDLETLAMLRKIKIDSWRNPIVLTVLKLLTKRGMQHLRQVERQVSFCNYHFVKIQ